MLHRKIDEILIFTRWKAPEADKTGDDKQINITLLTNVKPFQLPLSTERQHDVSVYNKYPYSHTAKQDFHSAPNFLRESTFLKHDIDGTVPRVLIPKNPH